MQLLLHLLLAFGSYMVIMLFSIMVTGQLHKDPADAAKKYVKHLPGRAARKTGGPSSFFLDAGR